MIIEDNFFPDPKIHPASVGVPELCERFAAAGLPCKLENVGDEVRIAFEDRRCYLILTVNASGRALCATMGDESDYDAQFASVLFDVFESVGWAYAPGLDDDDTSLIDAEAK